MAVGAVAVGVVPVGAFPPTPVEGDVVTLRAGGAPPRRCPGLDDLCPLRLGLLGRWATGLEGGTTEKRSPLLTIGACAEEDVVLCSETTRAEPWGRGDWLWPALALWDAPTCGREVMASATAVAAIAATTPPRATATRFRWRLGGRSELGFERGSPCWRRSDS